MTRNSSDGSRRNGRSGANCGEHVNGGVQPDLCDSSVPLQPRRGVGLHRRERASRWRRYQRRLWWRLSRQCWVDSVDSVRRCAAAISSAISVRRTLRPLWKLIALRARITCALAHVIMYGHEARHENGIQTHQISLCGSCCTPLISGTAGGSCI
jgi:hypothetical protein